MVAQPCRLRLRTIEGAAGSAGLLIILGELGMAIKLSARDAAALDKLVVAYETAKGELSDYLGDILAEWETEIGDKSEKWRESEAGQRAQERIDAVQAWFDELPGEGEPQIDSDSLK